MTYDSFKENLLLSLGEILPEDTKAKITPVLKNNSLALDSVIITEDGSNISPTIYLGYYYQLHQDGQEVTDVARLIYETYSAHKIAGGIDMSFFMNFENVKSKVFYKLVSKTRNEKLLEEAPFIDFLDLAIVFYFDATDISENIVVDGYASILIRKEHMSNWGIEVEELYAAASTNTPSRMLPIVRKMNEILLDAGYDLDNSSDFYDVLVLTNSRKINGASCILYDELLKGIATRSGTNLVILPSSIHEVILIPFDGDEHLFREYSLENFGMMIKSVNETNVEIDEILSDHAYFYDSRFNVIKY